MQTPVPERSSDRDTDAEVVQRDARVALDLQEPAQDRRLTKPSSQGLSKPHG